MQQGDILKVYDNSGLIQYYAKVGTSFSVALYELRKSRMVSQMIDLTQVKTTPMDTSAFNYDRIKYSLDRNKYYNDAAYEIEMSRPKDKFKGKLCAYHNRAHNVFIFIAGEVGYINTDTKRYNKGMHPYDGTDLVLVDDSGSQYAWFMHILTTKKYKSQHRFFSEQGNQQKKALSLDHEGKELVDGVLYKAQTINKPYYFMHNCEGVLWDNHDNYTDALLNKGTHKGSATKVIEGTETYDWAISCLHAKKYMMVQEARDYANNVEFKWDLKTDRTMFRKGEYIVITKSTVSNCFKENYCFKLRESSNRLVVLQDCDGHPNGVDFIKATNKHNWRYATTDEVAEYIKQGKPFDTSIEYVDFEEDMFKKGEYIVVIVSAGSPFEKGYCFKQRETFEYLRVEKDTAGHENGRQSIGAKSNHNWKYATTDEIAMYDRYDKPFDVTEMPDFGVISKFKKGAYIVITSYLGRNFKENYCYKQRCYAPWLRPELDSSGSATNGTQTVSFNNSKHWRWASTEESKEYDNHGKPYNTLEPKQDETMGFKKDEYIVIIGNRGHLHGDVSKNTVYKQYDENAYLNIYKDNVADRHYVDVVLYEDRANWRYATKPEIKAYDTDDKPVPCDPVANTFPTYTHNISVDDMVSISDQIIQWDGCTASITSLIDTTGRVTRVCPIGITISVRNGKGTVMLPAEYLIKLGSIIGEQLVLPNAKNDTERLRQQEKAVRFAVAYGGSKPMIAASLPTGFGKTWATQHHLNTIGFGEGIKVRLPPSTHLMPLTFSTESTPEQTKKRVMKHLLEDKYAVIEPEEIKPIKY